MMPMVKKFGPDRQCFANIATRRKTKSAGRWRRAGTSLRRLWSSIYSDQIRQFRRRLPPEPVRVEASE